MDERVVRELRAHGVQDGELVVIAPRRTTRLDRWTDDEEARRRSQERTDRVAEELAAAGFRARARLADVDVAQSLEDALRAEPVTGVLVAIGRTAPPETGAWERLGRLGAEAGVPVSRLALVPAESSRARHTGRRAYLLAAAAAVATAWLVVAATGAAAGTVLAPAAVVLGIVAINLAPKLVLVFAVVKLARRLL